MTNRIEAIERLQRLRESGALTDEEFRQEKAALLGRGDALDPEPPAAAIAESGAADAASEIYALPGRRGPPLWMMAGGALVLILVVVAAMLLLRGGTDRETFDVGSVPPANPIAEPTNEAQPAPEPAGIRARPEAEQLAAAFRTAFGGQPVRDAEDGEITYRPGRLLWIGERAVLISNGTNAEECHVCAGMVSVHHLLPDGGGFKVDGEWLRVASDDYGHPPEWSVTNELTGRPALRVDNGGGNQGVFCNFSTWYDLAGGRPSELARVQTGYTNQGEEGRFDLDGRIANLRAGGSFDVLYTGYESFTERYRWRGDRFEKEGGETRVPQC